MGIRDRSESRDGYAVRVLAVHTSEGNDKPVVDDAAALRDATWWEGSSHAIADNDPGSLLTPAEGCVPYDRASWTLRSGNRWSENIELIAQAGWTRAQWLARPKLLDRCAYWLAVRSKVDRGGGRRIPLVKITAAQYRAGAWGVIGHHDHTVGYSDGTHWDPGPGFPWDVVLAKAIAYRDGTTQGDDMPSFDDKIDWINPETKAPVSFTFAQWTVWTNWYASKAAAAGVATQQQIAALSGQVAGLAAAMQALASAGSSGIDPAVLEEVVARGSERGTEKALAGFEATVTIAGSDDDTPA